MRAATIPVIALCTVITTVGYSLDWPRFGGNSASQATTEDYSPRDLPNAEMAMSENLGIRPSSGLAVADGSVYAYSGGATGVLYCLDAKDLSVQWQAMMPEVSDPLGFGTWGMPAVDGANVVFAADDFLGCWNTNGTLRWKTNMVHQTVNSSASIVDSTILIGAFSFVNFEGGVAAYDLNTGDELWFNPVINNAAFSSCTPIVDPVDQGRGYACASNQVWCFNLATGSNHWQTTVPGGALHNLMLDNLGQLWVVNFDFAFGPTNMYVVDATFGALLDGVPCGMSDVPPALYTGGSGNPIVVHSAGDSAVAPQVTAFDALTRETLWQASTVGHLATQPVISRDVVYSAVGLYDGWTFTGMSNLTALNVMDGSVVSETGNLQGGQTPAVADDVLYTANNGVVYAYRWPAQALTVNKFKAKVKLAKAGKDGVMLQAHVRVNDPPTNFANALTISVGDVMMLDTVAGEMKVSQKDGQIRKVIVKAQNKLVDKSKTTVKWASKRKELMIKSSIKKTDLKGQLPYSDTDGTTSPELTTSIKGSDYSFYATSDDTVTSTTRKGKAKMKK